MSIIIPAHNEDKVIGAKLEKLISLNYPKELLEIIIASDNSTDQTNEIQVRIATLFVKPEN